MLMLLLLFFLFNLLACFGHTFLCLILKERTSLVVQCQGCRFDSWPGSLNLDASWTKKKIKTESRNSSVTNSLKTLKMVPIKKSLKILILKEKYVYILLLSFIIYQRIINFLSFLSYFLFPPYFSFLLLLFLLSFIPIGF